MIGLVDAIQVFPRRTHKLCGSVNKTKAKIKMASNGLVSELWKHQNFINMITMTKHFHYYVRIRLGLDLF